MLWLYCYRERDFSMAKRMKTIRAGCIVKTVLYTAPEPRDKAPVRAAKSRMTSAAQKAMNDKTARAKLEMILAENFDDNDLFVTLTYRDEDLPDTWDTALENVRKFIRNFREYRKRRGQVLKYVYTTEGRHGDHRLHHHLVISATGHDLEVIRRLWAYGDQIDIEYIKERGYSTLAQYMTKESMEGRPVGEPMWAGSKNLKKPKVTSRFVPNDTELEIPVGCFILEREEKMTEYGSYCYVKYRIPLWMQHRERAIGEPGREPFPAPISCS